jgi:hypothetical protein
MDWIGYFLAVAILGGALAYETYMSALGRERPGAPRMRPPGSFTIPTTTRVINP